MEVSGDPMDYYMIVTELFEDVMVRTGSGVVMLPIVIGASSMESLLINVSVFLYSNADAGIYDACRQASPGHAGRHHLAMQAGITWP